MPAEEFARLTLGELERLRRAWWQRVQREDHRAGQICCCLLEVHRKKESFPLHPADFFPSLEELRPAPPTDDELEAKLGEVFGAMGG